MSVTCTSRRLRTLCFDARWKTLVIFLHPSTFGSSTPSYAASVVDNHATDDDDDDSDVRIRDDSWRTLPPLVLLQVTSGHGRTNDQPEEYPHGRGIHVIVRCNFEYETKSAPDYLCKAAVILCCAHE